MCWLQQHGQVEAEFLNLIVSDHTPILIQLGSRVKLKPRPFKLFPHIMEEPEFQLIVEAVWQEQIRGDAMQKIWNKMHNLKERLKDFNKYMAAYKQALDKARQELDIVQARMVDTLSNQELIRREQELIKEIEKWSKIDEQALRQKSRAVWIPYGDANSKYFHAQLKLRGSKNAISSIHDSTGMRITDQALIERESLLLSSKV